MKLDQVDMGTTILTCQGKKQISLEKEVLLDL